MRTIKQQCSVSVDSVNISHLFCSGKIAFYDSNSRTIITLQNSDDTVPKTHKAVKKQLLLSNIYKSMVQIPQIQDFYRAE